MSEFAIISQRKEYEEIYTICEKIEQSTKPEEKALLCRNVLDELIKFIYQQECKKYPTSATLLELIDGSVISAFVDNPILLESLHFVRKVGMNAKHGLHVKKTQAKVACENMAFFVRFGVLKYEEPERVPDI